MSYIIFEEIRFVKENLELAKEYLADYKKSKTKKDLFALERVVEEIVETSIKINKKILKKINIIPISYKDSFLKLSKLKIFNENEIEKLSNTAIFRNELSHDYRNIDKLYTIKNIEQIINLYPLYLEKLINFLSED